MLGVWYEIQSPPPPFSLSLSLSLSLPQNKKRIHDALVLTIIWISNEN